MSMSTSERLAYRRAWLSLLLYPVTFVAAFVVGEGLLYLYGYPAHDDGLPPWWAVLGAALPAVLVFAVPAALAWLFAARAGHEDVHRARLPAYVASALAVAFVLQNLAAYLLSR